MKMIVGSTMNAKMLAYWPPSWPRTFVMIRGHTSGLPSGPNTNDDPT